MFAFVIRRLLITIPVILMATVLVFILVAASGDPLAELRGRQPPVPAEVIKAREAQLHLDKPLPERYWIWFSGFVFKGDMGATTEGREVRPLLFDRLGVTMRMVILSSLLAVIIAIVVGVFSAVRQYTALDYTFTFAGFLFLSMPVFWLAALLKEYVGIRINEAVGKQIIFTVGEETPNLTGDWLSRFANQLGHLILPTLALTLIAYAAWSRYQRASMLDVLSSDYIRLAKAKGLRPRRVLIRHALRNALIPLTTVVAIDTGAIFGGAILTERVFAWQGMGALLLQGVDRNDVNVVLAWLMISGIIVVLFNLIADVLYAVLDPRIRYG
jgi:peptide/nickel transport system permease protein